MLTSVDRFYPVSTRPVEIPVEKRVDAGTHDLLVNLSSPDVAALPVDR